MVSFWCLVQDYSVNTRSDLDALIHGGNISLSALRAVLWSVFLHCALLLQVSLVYPYEFVHRNQSDSEKQCWKALKALHIHTPPLFVSFPQNLYKTELNKEEMYIRYIHKLYDLHLKAQNYTGTQAWREPEVVWRYG